ncbi:hypothetical protein BT96DRAFT_941394 [Gymnopus androsaceus JB14]|uniref:Uncharacterized protein n=1 Tax=Gymnopus androsaceus JB14 TaxID=1447944 RepID=A0A6A4HI98_9AGAR|nr:hypothetical protein BT96DRAFT_941394 [Gymnopus androsaceus JB14]
MLFDSVPRRNHLLSSLEDEMPTLHGFGFDLNTPINEAETLSSGLLWQPTPSRCLPLPEELMDLALDRIDIATRRRGPVRLLSEDSFALRVASSAVPPSHQHQQYMLDLGTSDVERLNALFGFMAVSSDAIAPSKSKRVSSSDSRLGRRQSPRLSVLNLGSPRLNANIDLQTPASPSPSPLPMPTSPRWNRQNLPNAA